MTLTVLLVDDSAVMRRMIARTLELSGRAPRRGAVGRATANRRSRRRACEHVDLALVDINMPVMDGEELIDRLRAEPRTASLPVIVVSTESSPARVERLQRKGARFVHKPFTPEMLRDTIHAIPGLADACRLHAAAPAGGDLDF